MKAQMVKNAIIVPDGSKGGFILKRTPAHARPAEGGGHRAVRDVHAGIARHHRQPRSGVVVHPERVRVLDGDDTYLVVAADKGTATFSDTANGVAAEYGFWLGDAFASGGAPASTTRRSGSRRAVRGSR